MGLYSLGSILRRIDRPLLIQYLTIRIEHQENALRRMASRPTFEVVFLYDPDTGTLEVFVPGDRKAKTATARLFATVVLGVDSLLASSRAPYNLDVLQSRATSLTVKRADGVVLARIRRLRLALRTDHKQRILFEVPHEGGEKDIHDLIDDELRRPTTRRNLKTGERGSPMTIGAF